MKRTKQLGTRERRQTIGELPMKSLRFHYLFPLLTLLGACSGSGNGNGNGNGITAPTPGGACASGESYSDQCAACTCVDLTWSCSQTPCPDTSAGGSGTGVGGTGGHTGGSDGSGGSGATGPGTGGVGTGGTGAGGGPVDGCTGPAPSAACLCVRGSWECGISSCMDDAECEPGEYCKSPQAEGGCDLSRSPGTCETKPEACVPDTSQNPVFVCGCDEKTYSSLCEIAKAGINVGQEGPCQQSAL